MLGMRREDAVERLGSVLQSFRTAPHGVGGELLTVAASAGVAQPRRRGLRGAPLVVVTACSTDGSAPGS
jgi:hypothetical protein